MSPFPPALAILRPMAIEIVPKILLPTMDTERFERCSFSLQDVESLLTVHMSDLPPFIIHFHRLRWHRVTPKRSVRPGSPRDARWRWPKCSIHPR